MKKGTCSNCRAETDNLCTHCWKCQDCCECERFGLEKGNGKIKSHPVTGK